MKLGHPDYLSGNKRRYYLAHQERIRRQAAEYQKRNRTRLEIGARQYHRYKIAVLNRYSSGGAPKCACCGETRYEFLCVDHIKPVGGRKRVSYHELLRLPIRRKAYQILCHNCNQAKGDNEDCPHKTARFHSLDEWWEWAKPKMVRRGITLTNADASALGRMGRTLGRYRGLCSRWHDGRKKNRHGLCSDCYRAARKALGKAK